MYNFVTALLLSALLPASVQAQPDEKYLTINVQPPSPLEGTASAGEALIKDTYRIDFKIRNTSEIPLQLRRIALRHTAGIEVIAPDSDGLDNNHNGTVDEPLETFDQRDGPAVAWRIAETKSLIQPGGIFERTVKVRIAEDADIGIVQRLSLGAAATVTETTIRTEENVLFTLAPPKTRMTINNSGRGKVFSTTQTPSIEAKAVLPAGRVTALDFTFEGSPAVSGFLRTETSIGDGISCNTAPGTSVTGRRVTVLFGDCIVSAGTPRSDRTLTIKAAAVFTDADPFATADVIRAHRALRITGTLSTDGKQLGKQITVSGNLSGPLLGAQLLSMSDEPVDAGDMIEAVYRISNRGDGNATGLRLSVPDTAVFDCSDIEVTGIGYGHDTCAKPFEIYDIKTGQSDDIRVKARLRNDAHLSADAALRLLLSDVAGREVILPPALISKRTPAPPVLKLGPDTEWRPDKGLLTTRVGDSGSLLITGGLVEGRYEAGIRILSRVVDAQTGTPVAPAPLSVKRFTATVQGQPKTGLSANDITTRTENGWSITVHPLGMLTVPVSDTKPPQTFQASADILPGDIPQIRKGLILEIRAELALFGDTFVRDDSPVDLLIIEPDLDLTVRSPDEDRTINLHDSVPVIVSSCNRGTADAKSVILAAYLPQSLLPDTVEDAHIAIFPSEESTGHTRHKNSGPEAAGDIFFNSDEKVLRGALVPGAVLKPGHCLALDFAVRRSNTFLADQTAATINASLEPYTGKTELSSRIYPGLSGGEIRFELPAILFGPFSEKQVSDETAVSHRLSLEIPAAAGDHTVNLSVSGGTGLDWTILQLDETGTAKPWRNGTTVQAGDAVTFNLEAKLPVAKPLGWIDTTLVRAVAFSGNGIPVSASSRLITRRADVSGGRIDVTKTLALDRDCDGSLGDERNQDGLFEPVKDAAPGDCVMFRIAFRHNGNKNMERIIIRDQVPAGTALRPGAVRVIHAPKPITSYKTSLPEQSRKDVVWTFEGLFKPGAEGSVSYAVRLPDAAE